MSATSKRVAAETLRYPAAVPPSFADVPRYALYSVAISTVIAIALTAFGREGQGFWANLLYSQCIGLLTYSMIDLPRRLLWPRGAPAMIPMIAIVLAAAPVGWYGGGFVASALLGDPWRAQTLGLNTILGFLALTAGAGLGCTWLFWTRERMAGIERGAAEARLKLLRAQIEPHFLFNTLANLQALIGADPPRAQKMLGHLDGYLRATLASTRSDSSTLAREFALLTAYLEIISIRMGPRLAYSLDLPEALAAVRLPPMLLQPLVENAIRHGLEPKVEGGSVQVAASEASGALVLTVEDDGLGPAPDAAGRGPAATAGSGVGLAHVRERLATLYGAAGSCDCAAMPGGGTRVTLRLPLQR